MKKINNIHSHVPRQRHVRESSESDGIGGISEESFFYKDRIQKKKFIGGKTKSVIYFSMEISTGSGLSVWKS